MYQFLSHAKLNQGGRYPKRADIFRDLFREDEGGEALPLFSPGQTTLRWRVQRQLDARLKWKFFSLFGFHLGKQRQLDSHTHSNLFTKTLQETKIAAVSEQHLANLTKKQRSHKCTLIRASTFSTLTLSTRVKAWLASQRFQESNALRSDQRSVPNPSLTDKDHFRGVEESITRVSAIYQRFNQESLNSYAQRATILIKAQLLIVRSMSQSSSFFKHHILILGR